MLQNILNDHRRVYDSLSREYEDRVTKVSPVVAYTIEMLLKYLPPQSTVLDVGCGVGLAVALLNEKGVKASGIDLSHEMVMLAKERNPSSEIIEGEFLSLDLLPQYDGLYASAFIHLFPKVTALEVLRKMYQVLKPGGAMFIGTTKSATSQEGYQNKSDYRNPLPRFRKNWTQEELERSLAEVGFKIMFSEDVTDAFSKVWMDYIVQKPIIKQKL